MILVCCSFTKELIKFDDFRGSVSDLKNVLCDVGGFFEDDIYLLCNGKKISDNTHLTNGVIHVVCRLPGGKGGFGSMLRAIGAQIEKTTNREACRDLSGRRLRDINEEKRLKNWIAQQAEREQEAAERRRRKLERLRHEPKHNFHDVTYEEERSQLTEKVYDAVEQGFKQASKNNVLPGCSQKRKVESSATSTGSKKKCLWLDADEEELDSSDLSSDDDDDTAGTSMKGKELPTPCSSKDGTGAIDTSADGADEASCDDVKSTDVENETCNRDEVTK